MIRRSHYLDKIKPWMGKPVVKAITGLRRVGKSCFLRQMMEILREQGVPEKNIISIDKEQISFDFIRSYRDLYDYVEEKIASVEGKVFLFLDEVQEIEQWERTVASWSGRGERFDVTITGSNSTMFSGELATLLTGRYIQFSIHPLSFKEFLMFHPEYEKADNALDMYLRYGGMPGLRILETLNDEMVGSVLANIQDSIVLKDIVRRKKIRDVGFLANLMRFVYDNVGQNLSALAIAKYLKSQRVNANVQGVLNYLSALEESQLFTRPRRYDIKGKVHLAVNDKFYAEDLGLRYASVGFRVNDIAQVIENAVYNELKRRFDSVSVGEVDSFEIDFVAEKNRKPEYFQVTLNCTDAQTFERETRSLLSVRDNYPKTVVSYYPPVGHPDYQGIRFVSLRDFLLAAEG